MFGNVLNTKEFAYDLVLQSQGHIVVSYLDESSIVDISVDDAVTSILTEGFLGDILTLALSQKEKEQVLRKTIH